MLRIASRVCHHVNWIPVSMPIPYPRKNPLDFPQNPHGTVGMGIPMEVFIPDNWWCCDAVWQLKFIYCIYLFYYENRTRVLNKAIKNIYSVHENPIE